MLTPKQLKSFSFQSVGRNAYKATDVDTYMSEVYESYEQMFRENGELVKKISMLADKLAEFKNDSDNIRNALLTAERMKDKIVQEAEEQAKETIAVAEEKVKAVIEAINEKTAGVIEKATANAEYLVSDAQSQADELLKNAQANATKLLSKAQNIYDEQMATIKEETDREKSALEKLKKDSTQLRESLNIIYTKQLEMINHIPSFEEYETPTNESAEDFSDFDFLESEYKDDDEEEKMLADFITENKEELNLELEEIEQSSDESQIDEYISFENVEQTTKTEESNGIEEVIDDYITEQEDDYIEYAPLEYISNEEKEDNYNDKSDNSEYQSENKEQYKGQKEEVYEEDYEEDSEENIKNFRVNIEEFYSEEEDNDVINLKNFFRESEVKQ